MFKKPFEKEKGGQEMSLSETFPLVEERGAFSYWMLHHVHHQVVNYACCPVQAEQVVYTRI